MYCLFNPVLEAEILEESSCELQYIHTYSCSHHMVNRCQGFLGGSTALLAYLGKTLK